MRTPPPLDMHAHIDPDIEGRAIRELGAFIFAMTRSVEEFTRVSERHDSRAVWGVGVHPGLVRVNKAFNEGEFAEALKTAVFAGEVGLDGSSRVPLPDQVRVLRAVLAELQRQPRVVSVHSSGAHFQLLRELHRTPVSGVVLHWWTGSPELTDEAVRLGCYFSVPPAMVSSQEVLNRIPIDRLLPETDHPYGDRRTPSPRRPGGVHEVEQRIAKLYGREPRDVRIRFWRDLATLVDSVNSRERLAAEWQTVLRNLDRA